MTFPEKELSELGGKSLSTRKHSASSKGGKSHNDEKPHAQTATKPYPHATLSSVSSDVIQRLPNPPQNPFDKPEKPFQQAVKRKDKRSKRTMSPRPYCSKSHYEYTNEYRDQAIEQEKHDHIGHFSFYGVYQ